MYASERGALVYLTEKYTHFGLDPMLKTKS
jgi:hypothetical protein